MGIRKSGRPALRGTSPQRGSVARKRGTDDDAMHDTAASKWRCRNKRRGAAAGSAKDIDDCTDFGTINQNRPWTTGEFENYGSVNDIQSTTESRMPGYLVQPRRPRSAADVRVEPDTLTSQVITPGATRDSVSPTMATMKKDLASALGITNSDFNKEELILDALQAGGLPVDEMEEGALAFSVPPPPAMLRRVSFADEEGCFVGDGIGKGGGKRQRPPLSSVIDGGFESDEETGTKRRGSDAGARQYAAALVKAAHELMFADTRPDGLRPITGAPLADGKSADASGGVFVGLAGLRGFDLSFAGDTQNRIAHQPDLSRPNSSDDAHEESNAVSCPDTMQCALQQASLLDRAPGSLIQGEEESSRTTTGSPRGSSRKGARNSASAGSTENQAHYAARKRPRTAPSHPATRSTVPAPDNDTSQTRNSERETLAVPDIDIRGTVNGGAVTTTEETGAEATVSGVPVAVFTRKPAVQWSASDIGVDELVASANTVGRVSKVRNLRRKRLQI